MNENKIDNQPSKPARFIECVDRSAVRARACFMSLSAEARFYVLGIGLGAVGILLATVSENDEMAFVWRLGTCVFVCGLVPFCSRMYEWVWKHVFGKLIIVTIVALATNYAYGFGRQLVGGMVGGHPGPFVGTINVATILYSPVLCMLCLAVGGVVVVAGAMYQGVFALITSSFFAKDGKYMRRFLWASRIIALGIAVTCSQVWLSRSGEYVDWVEQRTATFLYVFDMYDDVEYTQKKGERAALLEDGRILIGSKTDDGYDFEIIKRHSDEGKM